MMFCDMHCDTIYVLRDKKDVGENISLRENDLHIDLIRLQKSGYLLQNFALFVDLGLYPDPWARFLRLCDLYDGQLRENGDIIAPVLRFSDIEKNRKEGRLSALLTVEEGGVCLGSIEKLRAIYERGVRMLTLTWNYENELGHPNLPISAGDDMYQHVTVAETEKGLTGRGLEFISEMESLGMIIDVSHLSDAGFWDVVEHAKKPFAASHSNARAVCPCVRNLTDDMIRALGERGGVTGLNFCPDFLTFEKGSRDELMDAAVAHARHIVNVGGEDVLGLGSDFDGIDTNEALPDASYVPALFDALKNAGFTERQLDKIASENVLRLYRDTL